MSFALRPDHRADDRSAAEKDRVLVAVVFAPELRRREVPDPYYGGQRGFEQAFDMVEAAALGLLDDIRQRHL